MILTSRLPVFALPLVLLAPLGAQDAAPVSVADGEATLVADGEVAGNAGNAPALSEEVVAPAELDEPVEPVRVMPAAPDLRLHAVYDAAYPPPAGMETVTTEMVIPGDREFLEVRETLELNPTPLAGPANLEVATHEDDDQGGILKLQFDRETGRILEVWSRQHLGQRIAVIYGDELLAAEPANEGLGRRLMVPLYLPTSALDELGWDGRSEREVARDQRDQAAFDRARALEEDGRLDWGRRGISLGEAMDSALDGDVLSNRLLAWLALNSGGEEDQFDALAELCWLAARDQHALWQRLLEQWPEGTARQLLAEILVAGRGEDDSGDPDWEDFEPSAFGSGDGGQPVESTGGAPVHLSPTDLEAEVGE